LRIRRRREFHLSETAPDAPITSDPTPIAIPNSTIALM
jgi:hypothetical protein